METSGYHTPAHYSAKYGIGAWALTVGRLPDGRYCVDHFNSYNGERTRHYFESSDEAHGYAENFCRPIRAAS